MILRPYQDDLVTRTRGSFRAGKRRPLIVLPTGGGKTVCFSYIAHGAVTLGNRVWIIAHRAELIRQAGNTLAQFGVGHGIIKAGVRPTESPVQVASIQSVVARIGKVEPPDLIVIDEAHHATAGQYRKVLDAYPSARVIGVTATPCRLDGRGLGDVFDDLIVGPSLGYLTDEGFLSPARYFAPPVVADLSGVRTSRGDYAANDLEESIAKPAITGDAVEHYRKFLDGKPMLSFCVSVAHAEAVAQAYRAAGYRAASVDGGLKDTDRDDRIGGLATGKYQIITSCDLIGEGLDVPVCTGAQLLRPTQSLVLHLQQIGRVLRVAPGKEHAIILDHVGNLARHGFASEEREWSLESKAKKQKQGEDVPVRSCPQCFAAHEPAPVCPYCGFEYPPRPKSKMEIRAGELLEIEARRKDRKKEEAACRSEEDFVRLGLERGYAKPRVWAYMRWKARGHRRFAK